ncbi:MAG TPA: LysR family transcriptional regulator [Steroidobacteraceae bacterium]|nr:LysR family transcriptional regulator [Steroidobacteraceae bacterium]
MSTVHLRIYLTRNCSIGPGKIDLLETVGRVGSIRQAARSMGMSYRRAWLLLDSLNRSFSESIIRASVGGAGGGGVVVTEFGADLIRHYRLATERVETLARAEFADIAKKALETKKGGGSTTDAGAGATVPARHAAMPRKKSTRRKARAPG